MKTSEKTELMVMKTSRSASVCEGGGGSRRPPPRSQSVRSGHRPRHHGLRPAGSDTGLDNAGRYHLPPPTNHHNSPAPRNGTSSAHAHATFKEGADEAISSLSRRGSSRRSTTHRKSNAFLDVPPPVAAVETDEEDPDNLRIRSFSFTHKGSAFLAKPQGIINRGDSFRKKRSRSNSLAETPPPHLSPLPSPEPTTYQVAMLGVPGVGKTALVSQFMTSECINAYDRQRDEPSQLSVHVMLNGEESELKFITEAESDGDDGPADLYLIVYSCVDKASFQKAEEYIGRLHHNPLSRNKPMILVANKIDLARSRAVSVQDGRCLACTYGAKFIEVSVGINHNVDELLVGILTQIRLKGNCDDKIPSRHWYNNHGMLRASLKARQMITWIFGKEDSKFKNCENLHVM